ncbi:MAG: hypothetical protein AAGK32_12000 [Actinomycetota bacterium]
MTEPAMAPASRVAGVGHRDRRPRRRRLSREESRRALLDEGLRQVDRQPVGPGLDHIHPASVAANLDLTSGAVYHHWESYDDFRDELMEELLAAGRFAAVSAFDDRSVAELTDRETIVELITAVTEDHWETMLDEHRRLRTNLGLWARDEPDVTARLADQYVELAKGWSAVIEALLGQYGLSPRPPFTMTSITSVVTALVEGLVVRSTSEPGSVPAATGEDGSEVSVFAAATAAFLSGAVRRSGDPDLWEHVEHSIGRDP